MKTKEWYSAKQIAELCKISERTIERRRIKMMNENQNTNWFRIKKRPYKYNYQFLSEFLSNDIFQMIKRIKQMETTIDCLKRNESIEQHLSYFHWDYFITISYAETLNEKQCFSLMSKFYEVINSLTKGSNRMFFVTEPFTNRTGNHNHLILKCNLTEVHLRQIMIEYLPKGIVDVKKYDPYLAGVFYLSKKGTKGENWDVLGNNLQHEASKIFATPRNP